jgi:hypothetical protein
MTDDLRLEIELRFDGEPDETGSTQPLEDLTDNPDARRHLDRLVLLRDLARRHDPASEIPRRRFNLPDARPRQAPWWLAIAATAAAVALFFWPGSRIEKPIPVVLVQPPAKATVRPVDGPVDRPPLEVELYGWANTPLRAPKQAARLVLSPASAFRKRSPADEILALELANASLQPRSGVQRFAVSKGSKVVPSPKPASPGPRARSTLPEV